MALKRDPHPDDGTKAALYADEKRGQFAVKSVRGKRPVHYQVLKDGKPVQDVEFRQVKREP